MRNKWFLAAALLVMCSSLAQAEDFGKIGVVDFKVLIDSTESGSSAKREVKEKGEALRAELQSYQADLKKKQEAYQRESVLWTEAQRKEKQQSFQNDLAQLKALQQQKAKEFNDFRQELINELKDEVIQYLEKKGESEGYALIIEKRSGEVLYAAPALDITPEVATHLNKDSKF